MVKNPPTMQETCVWSLGWENHLQEGMATYFIILAWRIPWTEEPGGLYSPWGSKQSDMTEWLSISQREHKAQYWIPLSTYSGILAFWLSQCPWFSGKESACQYRRCRFNPWVRKTPLEKEMGTHSSILAWRIPWTVGSGRLQSMGVTKELDMT